MYFLLFHTAVPATFDFHLNNCTLSVLCHLTNTFRHYEFNIISTLLSYKEKIVVFKSCMYNICNYMGAYTSVNVLLDINGNSMPKHGNSMPIYGISMPIHGNMLIYYLLHLGFIIYKEHNLELIYASGLKCDHMMKLGFSKYSVLLASTMRT